MRELISAKYQAVTDLPGPLCAVVKRLKYGKTYQEQLRAQAARSQERQYPGDWVFTFVEGDGQEFDYGLDFTECGICKYYHAQGADELTPYLCLMDGVVSKSFGLGLAPRARTPTATARVRHKRLRIVQIDGLIFVYIHHEDLAHRRQAAQEGRFLAIAPIGTHPGITQPQRLLVAHHLQRQIRFAAIAALGFGNAGFTTTRRIRCPPLRKVQTRIN